MPSQNIHVVQEVGTLEELYDQVAKLQKTLRYLLNGNLDFENVRVKGLTAETIDVDELSAITANMGKLTSGEVYGAYIATAEGTYPRAEMSATLNLFRALATATRYVSVESYDSSTGSPGMVWEDNGQGASAQMSSGRFSVVSENDAELGALNNVFITAANDITLAAISGVINIAGWSMVLNSLTGRTLQQDLNSKATSGASTSFVGNHDHGIPAGTQLATVGGGSVTWVPSGGHSHSQS